MERKIDAVGRILIPVEIRRKMKLEENDSIIIDFKDDTIILRKKNISNSCKLCGKQLFSKREIYLEFCEECEKKIKTLLETNPFK